MIIARIESATASVRLWLLMRRIRNTLPFFKTWSTVVVNRAHSNARAKGGRRLWLQIVDKTNITKCSRHGAVIECLTPIGAHKEHGGPIRVKNKSWLTIPISELAKGKTAEYVEMSGIKLFRPGRAGAKRRHCANVFPSPVPRCHACSGKPRTFPRDVSF